MEFLKKIKGSWSKLAKGDEGPRMSSLLKELGARDASIVLDDYFQLVGSFHPFFVQSVAHCGELAGLESEKAQKLNTAAENALNLMNSWRRNEIPLVKARREEIDSSISLVQRLALGRRFREMEVAPTCKRVADIMRTGLYVATGSYGPDQFAGLAAGAVYDVAEIRTSFPLYSFDLTGFSPGSIWGEGGDVDNLNAMYVEAGKELGLELEVAALFAEAYAVWREFGQLEIFTAEPTTWNRQGNSKSADFHFGAIRSFHNR